MKWGLLKDMPGIYEFNVADLKGLEGFRGKVG